MLLASGQTDAAFAQHGIKAHRQRPHKSVGIGQTQRLPNVIFHCLDMSVSHVFPDRTGEQDRLLGNITHAGTHYGQRQLTQINAIEPDAACFRIVKAFQQIKQRTFAGTGGSDHGEHLPRLHGERNISQDRRFRTRRVTERNTFDLQLQSLGLELQRRGRLDENALRIQQLNQPFGCPCCALQIAVHLGDGANGAGNDECVKYECDQLTGSDVAFFHVRTANPYHHANRRHDQQHHQRNEPCPLADTPNRNLECQVHPPVKCPGVGILMIERLHDLDVAQGFACLTAHIRETILTRSRQLTHAAAEQDNRRYHDRHTGDDDEGELYIGDKQQHQSTDKHQRVTQGNGDRGANDRL